MTQTQRNSERDATATIPPGTPRWVKFLGISALVIVVLLVVVMIIGGEHGPGRHMLPTSNAVHSEQQK